MRKEKDILLEENVKRTINAVLNEDVSGYYPDNVQKALFVINKIDELYDEDMIDILTPYMKKVLEQALKILKCAKKDKTITSAIRHGVYLIENLPLIHIHKVI